MPKDIFPSLLTLLVTALKDGNGRNNLVAGFRKCGIYPLDINQLPAQDIGTVAAAVDSILIKILSEMRSDGPKRPQKSKKSKLLQEK